MCIIHCRKYHLHNCNSNSLCTITIKIVTHIFAAETVTCISAAETSNCITATESHMHNCNRKIHQHSCIRKCHLKTCINATNVVTSITAIESVTSIVPTETTTCRIGHRNFPFFLFNWDSLHARLNSHYKAWSYKKGSTKKITGYRKFVKKEPTVTRYLLILDLKPLRS